MHDVSVAEWLKPTQKSTLSTTGFEPHGVRRVSGGQTIPDFELDRHSKGSSAK